MKHIFRYNICPHTWRSHHSPDFNRLPRCAPSVAHVRHVRACDKRTAWTNCVFKVNGSQNYSMFLKNYFCFSYVSMETPQGIALRSSFDKYIKTGLHLNSLRAGWRWSTGACGVAASTKSSGEAARIESEPALISANFFTFLVPLHQLLPARSRCSSLLALMTQRWAIQSL